VDAKDARTIAEGLLDSVLRAGRVQMAYFRTGVAVETKADRSPVTVVDHRSEEIILEGLNRIAPGVPVVAEEAVNAGRIPATGERFFLVDPLDGTKGYIRGKPEFTINIGLIEDGRPVFGILYAPALADFYVTLGPSEAANARLAPDAEVTTLAEAGLQPIRTRLPDPQALSALTSESHPDPTTEAFLDRYAVSERRGLSSSLKFGWIAKGEADLYPRARETSEWDTAAGHALLAAAGGSVTRLDGTPLLYGKADRRFVNPGFVAWGRAPLPPSR
jgi:3'(2'), 5'-bisphosphate nucleotidase